MPAASRLSHASSRAVGIGGRSGGSHRSTIARDVFPSANNLICDHRGVDQAVAAEPFPILRLRQPSALSNVILFLRTSSSPPVTQRDPSLPAPLPTISPPAMDALNPKSSRSSCSTCTTSSTSSGAEENRAPGLSEANLQRLNLRVRPVHLRYLILRWLKTIPVALPAEACS